MSPNLSVWSVSRRRRSTTAGVSVVWRSFWSWPPRSSGWLVLVSGSRSASVGWSPRRGGTRARARRRRRRIRRRRASSGGRRRARRRRSCWPRRAPSARRARRRAIEARAASSRRRIRSMRSSSTTRTAAGVVVTSSARMSAGRMAGSGATRWPSCRRLACCWSSIARTGCVARTAVPRRRPRCRPRSASSAFGPRLRAAIVTLTARNRISRRGGQRVGGRAVRRAAFERQRGRDLPARLRRARRPV